MNMTDLGNSWGDDIAVEVEALQATYGEEVVIDEAQHQVSMLLTPVHEPSQQQYVQCQLLLTLDDQYPSKPPSIQLADVKGFTARQDQLQQQLATEASELAGELLLGLLFEAARTWLTENNWPEGPCIFCLEDLTPADHSSSSSSSGPGGSDGASQLHPLMRLPCFHAFHEHCFAAWWCWQQQAYTEQQRALEAKTGATAAATLVQETLPCKDGQQFQLSCPSCRAPFLLQDLQQHMQKQLQEQLAKQQQQQQHTKHKQGAEQQQQHAAAARLSAAQLEPFLELQRRHARLFAQQQQRQGIIVTDSSYCIADWQGPSTAAASASAALPAATNPAADIAVGDRSYRGRGAGRGRGSSRGGSSRGGRRPQDRGSHTTQPLQSGLPHQVPHPPQEQHQQSITGRQGICESGQHSHQCRPAAVPPHQQSADDRPAVMQPGSQQQQQQQSWRGGRGGGSRGRRARGRGGGV